MLDVIFFETFVIGSQHTVIRDVYKRQLLKNAPAIIAMIGSFAPQGTNVVVMIVILRSRSFSIVREAITPGTPHPEPISIGIKAVSYTHLDVYKRQEHGR